MFSRMSTIRTKYLLVLVPAVLLAAIFVSGIFGWRSYGQLNLQLSERKDNLAAFHSAALAGPMWNFDEAVIGHILDALALDPDVLAATVLDDADKKLAEIGSMDISQLDAYGDSVVTRRIVHRGESQIYSVGTLIIRFDNTRVQDQILDQIWRDASMVGILVLSISIVSILANRAIVGVPLDRFLQAIRRAETATSRESLGEYSDDEIGKVVLAYDNLLLKLKEEEAALTHARDQAEHARLDVEEKSRVLEATLANMRDGLALLDSDGFIVMQNERLALMFPEAAGEQLGRLRLEDLVDATKVHDWENVAASLQRLTAEGAGTSGQEILMEFVDGHILRLRTDEMPDGGWVVSSQDITDDRRREEALTLAKIEAEMATNAKSMFLATMSHEIRTPMNGIMSMAELLEKTELESEQKGMVTIVRESASSLLTILNDILDFSKIEAGKLELEPLPFSMPDLVEGVTDLLAPKAEEKGIEIGSFIAPDLPLVFRGDPTRLRQILLNLLGNALKFTEFGSVRVDVRPDQGKGGGNVVGLVFEVIDTGIGMSEEQCRALFQPFQQADASTARRYGGTGLGLSICARLVELMGGTIGVRSEVGKGSVFFVHIPLEQVDAQYRYGSDFSDTIPQDLDFAGKRVSLILGKYAEEEVFRRYLGNLGAEVEVFRAGNRAIEQSRAAVVRGRAPDVAIFDQDLADMSGLECGQKFAADSALKTVKRILLVPKSSGSERGFALDNGFNAIVNKPLHRAELLRQTGVVLGLVEAREERKTSYQQDQIWQAPSKPEAEEKGGLILVAEDNPTNQLVVRKLLERLGFACDMAENGVDALIMLRDRDYGMLLTDCHMPDMDGYELSRQIRALESAAEDEGEEVTRLPIVALTADALTGTAQKCLNAGMDDYLSKPVAIQDLNDAIVKWLPVTAELRQAVTMHEDKPAAKTEPETVPETTPEVVEDAAPVPAPDTSPAQAVETADIPAPAEEHTASQDAQDSETMPMRPEVLDIEKVKAVFGEMNDDAISMLGFFVDTTRPLIDDLKQQFASGDMAAARRAAHSIKGSAATAGAEELGYVAANIQDLLDSGDHDKAKGFGDDVEESFDRLSKAIAAL